MSSGEHYKNLSYNLWRLGGQVQADRPPSRVPERILRLAHAEYDRGRYGQTFERLQERGGFSLAEIIALLADAAERHGAQPTKPFDPFDPEAPR